MSRPPTAPVPPLLDYDVSAADPALRAALAAAEGSALPALRHSPVLAGRFEAGLRSRTCVLVPRVLPDSSHNAIALQRIKDKLGDRCNASAEIEYDALGWRVGDQGRGLPTVLEMVTMTRLDCVLGSAGELRAGRPRPPSMRAAGPRSASNCPGSRR